jgi:hypothetical protein
MTNFYPTYNIGAQESTTVEFKTSLFFRAGSSVVDITQMDVITKVIASMMNVEGGSLYIGVNDRGQASKSIKDEFVYLGQYLPYANYSYSTNLDGYKRFILDWVSKNLGNFAATLLSFEIVQYNDIFVCRIGIKKSKVPVWFKHEALYVRADASTRQLRGNDITSFIMQIDKADFVKATADERAAFEKRLAEIKKKEAPNGRILVVYPNGDHIHEKFNYATMMEVIRRAGVVDVMNLSITGHSGKGNTPYVPLISTTRYMDKSGKTQHELGDYLVLTKIGVGEMISALTQISNGLGLNLHIEKY